MIKTSKIIEFVVHWPCDIQARFSNNRRVRRRDDGKPQQRCWTAKVWRCATMVDEFNGDGFEFYNSMYFCIWREKRNAQWLLI